MQADVPIIDASEDGHVPILTSKTFILNASASVFIPRASVVDDYYSTTNLVGTGTAELTPVKLELYTAYYCNARSLRNNLTELHALLYSGTYTILCFVETWLCSIFSDSQLDPQGLFNIYRRDRKSQRPAGGVCIFISINLHSMHSEINLSEFEDAEVVAVNVLASAVTHITSICAYVPPNLPQDVFNSSILCIEKLSLFSESTI